MKQGLVDKFPPFRPCAARYRDNTSKHFWQSPQLNDDVRPLLKSSVSRKAVSRNSADCRKQSRFEKVFLMTVTLELPAELEVELRQCSALVSQSTAAFILDAVKEKLSRTRTTAAESPVLKATACHRTGTAEVDSTPNDAERAFDELCRPIAEDFNATGLTEDDLDVLVEEIREEVWQSKQSASSCS